MQRQEPLCLGCEVDKNVDKYNKKGRNGKQNESEERAIDWGWELITDQKSQERGGKS